MLDDVHDVSNTRGGFHFQHGAELVVVPICHLVQTGGEVVQLLDAGILGDVQVGEGCFIIGHQVPLIIDADPIWWNRQFYPLAQQIVLARGNACDVELRLSMILVSLPFLCDVTLLMAEVKNIPRQQKCPGSEEPGHEI